MKLFFLILISFAFSGCASFPPTSESLDWNPENFVLAGLEKTGWKGIRGNETLNLIYAKKGETSENWTEKAESLELPIAVTLGGGFSWNPESVMNRDKAHMQKQQCSTDMWTVLQKNPRDDRQLFTTFLKHSFDRKESQLLFQFVDLG